MTETQSNSIARLIETGSEVNFDLARNAAVACGADAEFLKDLERRIEIEEFISQIPGLLRADWHDVAASIQEHVSWVNVSK